MLAGFGVAAARGRWAEGATVGAAAGWDMARPPRGWATPPRYSPRQARDPPGAYGSASHFSHYLGKRKAPPPPGSKGGAVDEGNTEALLRSDVTISKVRPNPCPGKT